MSAVTIAQDIETGASIVGQIASGAQKALPWINLVAGFFPGAASVIAALEIAAPIIQRVAIVAPLAAQAIQDGMPIAQAIDGASPALLDDIKKIYAVFRTATVEHTDPEDVSDDTAYQFAGPVLFGRQWTDAETQRWWDKAQGTLG